MASKNLEKQNMMLLKSISLYWTFIALGVACTLLGTTLVHMEKLLDIGAQKMSTSITFFAIGYLGGSIFCAILYDHLKPEFLFFIFNVLACGSTIGAGFMRSFLPFIAFVVVKGLGLGFIDTAGQSYGVRIWSEHRFKNSLIQILHVSWSFGGIIGPFIINPFLCEINQAVDRLNMTLNVSEVVVISDTISGNISTVCHDGIKLETVQKAFITVGGIVLSANIPFLVILIINIVKNKDVSILRKKKNNVTTENIADKRISNGKIKLFGNRIQQSLRLKLVLFAFMFLFGILNFYVEGITIAFLVSFALKHLHWSVYHSSFLLSLFFGAHFACRLLGAVVSSFLRPRTLLAITMSTNAVAFLLMLVVDYLPEIIWGAVLLAGLGNGINFPTNVIWISENLILTGRASSILVGGVSVGWITGPLLVGMLTSNYGQMSLIYFLICSSLTFLVLFISQALFITKFRGKDVKIQSIEVITIN